MISYPITEIQDLFSFIRGFGYQCQLIKLTTFIKNNGGFFCIFHFFDDRFNQTLAVLTAATGYNDENSKANEEEEGDAGDEEDRDADEVLMELH